MDKRQTKTPIIDMLKSFRERKPEYFCIPSHHMGTGAGGAFKDIAGDVLAYDITETPLTDDLHEPEGAIKEAEELAAELFGAKRTFFLVNGTTCANEAMLTAAAHEGEKVLVARNCHKSVLMGLIISGAEPVFIEPEKCSEFGTYGSLSPEKAQRAFEENPGIRALMLTSPTYHGIASDLEKLAEICHRHNALLLVDEAHGAHFNFSDRLPKTALLSGADMAAQSIHKTLGSMTQSSMLHVNGGDINRVDEALKIVQSTSPSYILMASLDGARHSMAVNGKGLVSNMVDTAEYIRERLNRLGNVRCLDTADGKNVFALDRARLVFSIEGISGFELADRLLHEYSICTEMADSRSVIAVIGHADTKRSADRLIEAVKKISAEAAPAPELPFRFPDIPPMAAVPRKAFFAESERIDFKKAVGMVSAEMIAPYPPGIPVIYPGEIITEDIHSFITEAVENRRHIHGFSDKTMKTIKIIKRL